MIQHVVMLSLPGAYDDAELVDVMHGLAARKKVTGL